MMKKLGKICEKNYGKNWGKNFAFKLMTHVFLLMINGESISCKKLWKKKPEN